MRLLSLQNMVWSTAVVPHSTGNIQAGVQRGLRVLRLSEGAGRGQSRSISISTLVGAI